MTTFERVRALVERLAPEPICDRCIQKTIDLGADRHAAMMARELAASPDFERKIGTCALCGATEPAIRRR